MDRRGQRNKTYRIASGPSELKGPGPSWYAFHVLYLQVDSPCDPNVPQAQKVSHTANPHTQQKPRCTEAMARCPLHRSSLRPGRADTSPERARSRPPKVTLGTSSAYRHPDASPKGRAYSALVVPMAQNYNSQCLPTRASEAQDAATETSDGKNCRHTAKLGDRFCPDTTRSGPKGARICGPSGPGSGCL